MILSELDKLTGKWNALKIDLATIFGGGCQNEKRLYKNAFYNPSVRGAVVVVDSFFVERMRLAAIEGGGTTWLVGILEDTTEEFKEIREFPTTTPEETLATIKAYLLTKGQLDAIGVASFGPIDATKNSPRYGYITSTPKPGWTNTDVLRLLGCYDEFKDIPVSFDTDVNAPAMSEFQAMLPTNPLATSCAYISCGTGAGVGLVVNKQTVKGLLHPEGGHIFVRPHPDDDVGFRGTCPFHTSCVEGMVSTGSLAMRLKCDRSELPNFPDEHPIWDLCAHYLAQLCVNLILIASPEKIVIGGGVMKRSILYPKVRKSVIATLNEYIVSPSLTEGNIDDYITSSKWGDHAGLAGAAYLAYLAATEK